MSETHFQKLADLADIAPGKSLKVSAGGKSILICNSADQIFAVANRCSHAEEPLECGRIRNGWISCPTHGARFDLETGAAMNPPAKDPIETFRVRIVDGAIEVEI